MTVFILLKEVTPEKALVEYRSEYYDDLPPEIIAKGIVVDKIPASEPKPFMLETLYYNPQTEKFFYEYVERPLSPDEEVKKLQDVIAQLLIEKAQDTDKMSAFEKNQGEMLMEIAMLKMGGNL